MKTFSTLLITTISLVMIYTATAAVMVPASVSVPDYATGSSRLVKAVKYNGVYIPVVELPEIEIIAKRSETVILKGNLTKGVLKVEVNLPVVEIYANRNSFQKIPAYIKNGEMIAMADLPLIEIEESLPYQKMYPVNGGESINLPVVNLPAISILPENPITFVLSATDVNGKIMPLIHLPVIEISPDFTWLVTTMDKEFPGKEEVAWIYISLKNCGITIENKVICEVASKINTGSFNLPELPSSH